MQRARGDSVSAKPRDFRPKIISFNQVMHGLNIASEESILWPCHAFSISIPQKKKSVLNVFEETVLRMTGIESGDTAKIAELTCLERELVSFIQNRLNQLRLLTDRNELSEYGREFMQDWQSRSDGNLEYTVVTVFIDLLSGRLLPYVCSEKLNYKKIVEISDNGFVYFLRNSTDERTIKAKQIHPSKDSYWEAVPDTDNIIKSIREFRKKYKRYALLNQDVEQNPPFVPMAEAISVHNNPELIYLHCNVLIQRGNSDLLVTDGFGFGFSESFAHYLTSQNPQWIIKMKSKGIIDKQISEQKVEKGEEEPTSTFVEENYPQIRRQQKYAVEFYSQAIKTHINSSNDELEFIKLTSDAVIALYQAIEWTLRYVVSDNLAVHWEHLFSSQSYRNNDKILCSFAAKIGFNLSGDVKSLLQVRPGKIQALDRGIAEMQPLLAMAIAGALNNPTHPFQRLAVEDPESLSFINSLKAMRDPAKHGNSMAVKISHKDLESLLKRTNRLIEILLPDLSVNEYVANNKQDNDINQQRLKARIDLDKSLGLGFIQSVSPSLREELIRLTVLGQCQTLDKDQLQNYVNLLASIMQLSLTEISKNRRISGTTDRDLREDALRKIVQSGFYTSYEAIPEQIRTVNVKRLYDVIQGLSSTLGAHFLSVFLFGSEFELIQLRGSDPTLVEFIANLIMLRGHGNQQQHDISQTEIESLKNNLYKSIKIIMEVF